MEYECMTRSMRKIFMRCNRWLNVEQVYRTPADSFISEPI